MGLGNDQIVSIISIRSAFPKACSRHGSTLKVPGCSLSQFRDAHVAAQVKFSSAGAKVSILVFARKVSHLQASHLKQQKGSLKWPFASSLYLWSQ